MAAPTVKIRKDEDGGYSLVAAPGGVEVVFATVNPSQLAEAAFAQGKGVADDGGDDDDNGKG